MGSDASRRCPRAGRVPRLLPAAAVAVAVVVATTSVVVAQDLDTARDRADGLREQLAHTTEEYERLTGEVARTEEDVERLEQQADELAERADELDATLEQRAREVFIRGAAADLELLLAAEGPEVAVERAALVEALQSRERADLESAVAARTALDQVTVLTEQRREELDQLTAQLDAQADELADDLSAAEATVDDLEARAARQRQISEGDQQGTYACPLDPGVTHFIDSWGFPRSGGRSHQGTDIMGPMGSPVYAFTDGVVSRHSNSRLGGISLYLRGDDGQTYFYTHLQGYASAGAVGNRVEAGEHIAYNGNTGNARGGAPHIHFERHPGGGSAVNPYPWLARACF